MAKTPADFVTLQPWREIADELSHENSTERVLELSQQLNRAMEAQTGPIQKTSQDRCACRDAA